MRLPPETVEYARALRREATPMETRLRSRLRNRAVAGCRFRFQHPVGPFYADFICLERRLVLEVDGDSHATRTKRDDERTAWLEARGFRVIRFGNPEIAENLEGVLLRIESELGRSPVRRKW
ncbi:MAG: endonuclease domain-containing protein [Myxococcota bacterium]